MTNYLTPGIDTGGEVLSERIFCLPVTLYHPGRIPVISFAIYDLFHLT
jgi:hypothetical protein